MATAAYPVKVKIGTDVLKVRGGVTVKAGKGSIEMTCLGDTSRSYILGIEDEVRFTLPVVRDTTNAAYSALQTAYTNATTVDFSVVDTDGTTVIWEANMYVTSKESALSNDDAEITNFEFLKTGATTTDAI